MLFFISLRVQHWNQGYNMANIVFISTNQIADILYVSDNNK